MTSVGWVPWWCRRAPVDAGALTATDRAALLRAVARDRQRLRGQQARAEELTREITERRDRNGLSDAFIDLWQGRGR